MHSNVQGATHYITHHIIVNFCSNLQLRDVVIKHLNIYSLDVHYKMELNRIITFITLIFKTTYNHYSPWHGILHYHSWIPNSERISYYEIFW